MLFIKSKIKAIVTSDFISGGKLFLILGYHTFRLGYTQIFRGIANDLVGNIDFGEDFGNALEDTVTLALDGSVIEVGGYLGGMAAVFGGARHPLSVSLKMLEDSDKLGGDWYEKETNEELKEDNDEGGKADKADKADDRMDHEQDGEGGGDEIEEVGDDLEDEGLPRYTESNTKATAIIMSDIYYFGYRKRINEILNTQQSSNTIRGIHHDDSSSGSSSSIDFIKESSLNFHLIEGDSNNIEENYNIEDEFMDHKLNQIYHLEYIKLRYFKRMCNRLNDNHKLINISNKFYFDPINNGTTLSSTVNRVIFEKKLEPFIKGYYIRFRSHIIELAQNESDEMTGMVKVN